MPRCASGLRSQLKPFSSPYQIIIAVIQTRAFVNHSASSGPSAFKERLPSAERSSNVLRQLQSPLNIAECEDLLEFGAEGAPAVAFDLNRCLGISCLGLVCIGVLAGAEQQDGSQSEERIFSRLACHSVLDTVVQYFKAVRSCASALIRYSAVGVENLNEEGEFTIRGDFLCLRELARP
jgi:hypothetical protein